jgi:hypothetical protein
MIKTPWGALRGSLHVPSKEFKSLNAAEHSKYDRRSTRPSTNSLKRRYRVLPVAGINLSYTHIVEEGFRGRPWDVGQI